MKTNIATKANITLKLDKDLLRKARILAAEEGTSVSALLATKLEEVVRERTDYDQAKGRALAILRERRELHWERPRSRDELHER
jgi:hypothetical protein